MEIYNHPTRHYLQPVNGFSAMEHLNFTAPIAKSALYCDNGSGTPAGIPAGSVMHLNENGALETGATGTDLAMFLLYNSWDPDAYMGYQTADGKDITAISMNSAGVLRPSETKPQTPGIADSAAISRAQSGGLWKSAWSGNTVSHERKEASGNYTVWPATCGMELSTTEWDLSISTPATAFVPGTPLTSPEADDEASSSGCTTQDDWNKFYQKKRGGFVTPAKTQSRTVGEGASATTQSYVDNICGVVSRGFRINEHNVPVVYFHACYIPDTTVVPDAE